MSPVRPGAARVGSTNRTITRSNHPGTDRAAELLSDVARGDKHAFATLYDEFAPRVLGMAGRVIVDRTLAEDVTQEVFLEVWQNATAFDPERGSGINWMLTLTRRRAIDHVRSEQASRERTERVGVREFTGAIDTSADVAETLELRGFIRRALDTLSEAQRAAISLQYSGYSQSEIARRLGVPLGTVKTRVRDGLAQLRLAV